MWRITLILALPILIGGTQPADALRRGNIAYERGDYESAVRAYSQAESTITDPGLAAFNKATALYQRGKYRDAEQAFRCALEDAVGPRRTFALYGLGSALVQQGRERGAEVLREAVRCYEACIQRDDISADLADDACHNIELAKMLLATISPKSSDKPDTRPDDKEEKPKPPQPRTTPESGEEPVGKGKADSRGEKQRVRKDQAKDAQQTDEGAPGAGRELPPVPDQEDMAPMSPEDAQEHLKRAAARVMSEQRVHQKLKRARGSNENGLDW
jgi:tetratricopeptide (TPR) repeat protein